MNYLKCWFITLKEYYDLLDKTNRKYCPLWDKLLVSNIERFADCATLEEQNTLRNCNSILVINNVVCHIGNYDSYLFPSIRTPVGCDPHSSKHASLFTMFKLVCILGRLSQEENRKIKKEKAEDEELYNNTLRAKLNELQETE